MNDGIGTSRTACISSEARLKRFLPGVIPRLILLISLVRRLSTKILVPSPPMIFLVRVQATLQLAFCVATRRYLEVGLYDRPIDHTS